LMRIVLLLAMEAYLFRCRDVSADGPDVQPSAMSQLHN
jgi:hypothetical protein